MSEREEQNFTNTFGTYDQAPQTNMNQPVTLEAQKRGNVLLGIIGAIIGAVLGGVLWVIVMQFGYIVGLVGAATIFLSLKGYELFVKKLDKLGVIVALIATVVAIFLAECVACTIEVHNLYGEYYGNSFFDSFGDAMKLIKTEGEVTAAIIKDLVIGYIFTILASFSIIRNALKGEN